MNLEKNLDYYEKYIHYMNLLSPIFSGESTVYILDIKQELFKNNLELKVYATNGYVRINGIRMKGKNELIDYVIEQMRIHLVKEEADERSKQREVP